MFYLTSSILSRFDFYRSLADPLVMLGRVSPARAWSALGT